MAWDFDIKGLYTDKVLWMKGDMCRDSAVLTIFVPPRRANIGKFVLSNRRRFYYYQSKGGMSFCVTTKGTWYIYACHSMRIRQLN